MCGPLLVCCSLSLAASASFPPMEPKCYLDARVRRGNGFSKLEPPFCRPKTGVRHDNPPPAFCKPLPIFPLPPFSFFVCHGMPLFSAFQRPEPPGPETQKATRCRRIPPLKPWHGLVEGNAGRRAARTCRRLLLQPFPKCQFSAVEKLRADSRDFSPGSRTPKGLPQPARRVNSSGRTGPGPDAPRHAVLGLYDFACPP